MSNNDQSIVARLFPALMLFCLLTGVWSFAIIQAWPWDKDTNWKPGVRLPVMCANGEVCSKEYSQIAKGVEEKQITALKLDILGLEMVARMSQEDLDNPKITGHYQNYDSRRKR